MSQQQQIQSMQQQHQVTQQSSTVSQNVTQQQTQQQTMVQQQTQQQTRVIREVRHGMQTVPGAMLMMPVGLPPGASPPVFEQIFRNARFAQGGDALFEGKVVGNPNPTISWIRKGQPLQPGPKYQVTHDQNTGMVTLNICAIGPGDEGEYVCNASNEYGEAICTVYIQPEVAHMIQQQRQQQQQMQMKQTTQTFMQQQQMQQERTQQQQMQMMQNGQVESFRVDTFEYRILHEVEYRQTLTQRLPGEQDVGRAGPLQGPPQAPQVQQKPRATKITEGNNATFTVKVTANPSPRIIWFKNGERLVSSEKYLMSQSAGQVTLVVTNVTAADSGYYTILAENSSGCTVTSGQLAVLPRGVTVINGQASPEVIRSERIETQMEFDSTEESGKALEPKFIKVPTPQTVQEGKLVRFDCRAAGRPYPDVTWLFNGQVITNDENHKILVNEQGNHSLMITQATLRDAGMIGCIARNKSGEASFQVPLNVLEREQVVAPKFVERFQQGQVREGETVQLHARAVGTPIPTLSWQKDGVTILPSHNVQIQSDGGASVIQILSTSAADAGWYQCTAQNVAGSAATRARLHVQADKSAVPQSAPRPHFPKPVKVIEPEKEPQPEIIYLRHIERAHQQIKGPEEEQPTEAPRFTHFLRDNEIAESQRAHFEARVTPMGDATMRIEWLVDGKPLAASSRATVTYRFGYVALDILSVIKADSGVYTCVATNVIGQAETSSNLRVTEKPTIESGTQHPEAMQQIHYLEDAGRYQRSTSMDEQSNIKPVFVKTLADLGDLVEGKYAHFEAQLHPVSDPFMKIEWFKDGKSITASSRINVIYNFGYVALTIMHLRPEDTGIYTVRATNKAGECSCQATVRVTTISDVTSDLGIPEQAQYIKSVEEMEAYRLQMQQRQAQELLESTTAPIFKTNLKEASAKEGGYAHFEARLEPVGDPTLKVEWLKDGRPIEASSRITTFFNFGYVALTIKALIVQDAGVYTCRAYNAKGEATNSAKLIVISKTDIEVDSQYEETVMKMQFLEDAARRQRSETQESTVSTMPPKFLGPLKGTSKIVEGQKAHFEVRLEPQNDSSMKVEWYFNGKVIMDASRIKFYNDFGYVALDISDIRSSDTGTYTCVARNSMGEAQISATMEVETRSTIDYSTMHEVTMNKTAAMERRHQEPHYDIEEYTKSKPVFTQPLHDLKPMPEGKNVHLEARLEPTGDPTLKVEWYFNGKAVTVGSRFRTYFDFGYVALDILGVYNTDSGEYTCRAVNLLGEAHTSACIQVIGTHDIETETMHDSALEQIQFLEGGRHQRPLPEEVDINQPPSFSKSLKNIETIEGTNIHLEARLLPIGDSSMRVEWFFNDMPLKVGHRFRPAYDFDYVALDLLSVYPVDSGIYTCRATNKLGQAVTSASVKVIAKKDLIFDSEHPDSLQKLQYFEDSSRYQRKEHMDEVSVKIKPKFLTQIKDQTLKENMTAHFEAKIEPITDANLRVEWYKDGRPLAAGSRFRHIHDFGYVALDIRNLVAEDSGVYTCVATNLLGKDEITATLKCIQSSNIIMDSQSETMTQEQLRMLEERRKYERTEVEETTQQAPVFTTSLKNVEILEGQRAHFEIKLIPTTDPTMKVEWFFNNQRVKSGSRFTEYNDFGFVALDIMYAYAEDSGTYTCVATNAVGQAITSGTLVVHTKDSILLDTMNQEAMQKITRLESKSQRSLTSEEMTFQAPVFTSPLRDQSLAENAPLHFEARLIPVGDPDLKVEWFKNGIPLQPANRISTMHDFGYVALDMKYVNPEDSGTYTCRATNKLGQAVCSASLAVTSKHALLLESQHGDALEKLRYLEDSSRYAKSSTEETVVTQAPKFVVNLSGMTQLWEGQSAHVEGRLEPYPDPTMKVEWFHNGQPLQVGHRFRTMYDFGFVAMDILSAIANDSGTYEVRATNRLGTTSSSITIGVKSKSDFIVESQHPEALAKIKRLEQKGTGRAAEETVEIEKPNFGRALRNQDKLIEGQAVHMEATLTPVNDPTMKVEWFFNGVPIPTAHRFRTTYDFGFVALDILYAYPGDSGTYMCRATNAAGQAVTSCNIRVEETDSMLTDTLDEGRLRKIRKLEQTTKMEVDIQEQVDMKPVFTTALQNQDNIAESERVHLECRLEPINDPNLKVEWFVNGVEIKAGHRFRTTHDFGYVALDILYAYGEDSGTYLCKATNRVGEAVNSCSVNITSRRSIYMDTHHPVGWEKIQSLEHKARYERLEVADLPNQPPRFTSQLRGVTSLGEGQRAHIEGRIEPIHDPSMRIEWYHNGQIIPSAARFHTTFDFGYVAFDLTSVYAEDSGEYTCRAFNNLGEAKSTVNLKIAGSGNIIYESARPEGLDKIRELEDSARLGSQVSEEIRTFQRPVFTQPLQNLDNVNEGEVAHFECRLIPVGDPKLKVEWFRNEKSIETSSRINRTHDFGYVALDIMGVRSDDEGIYMCRAYNDLGEAVTTASMKIKSHATIQMDTHHPEGMRKIQALEDRKPTGLGDEPDKVYDKPMFTVALAGPSQLMEGSRAHYECRVVPVGDPTMKFEWYCNGVALKMGSRFHTTHDFGFVTLDILQTIPEDSGVYMCKAFNKSGEAVSSCTTHVIGRDSIIGEAAHPQGWEAIRLRETQWNRVPQTPMSPEVAEPPMFTKHLESYDRLQEGGSISLEAQVQPASDPYLSIEWFKNGVQLATGTRIRSTFDFGHVLLHISGLREDDSGIYTCKAVNRVGEAVSTCNLKVHDRDWLIGDSVRPEALPKLAQLEQRRAGAPQESEPTYDTPIFISHLNDVECREGDTAHFECRVEPSKDPTMKIEWFINGKPMQAAARYKANYDFGFVSLDCTHCYAEDSGLYMCKATNSKGSASTTGTLTCIGKANLYFDTQHPQGKAGLEKVEEAERAFFEKNKPRALEKDVTFPKPFFIRPLEPNFTLMENQNLHMEANVEPKQDPDLKIEWFLNGKPLEHGSRYKSSYDFGLVTLDLMDCYERDQGIYTCRAYNKYGEAFCTTAVVVAAKGTLIEGTQHPAGDAGLEAIQRMEESLRRHDRAIPDEEGHPPIFTTEFKSLANIEESEIAHFEAMLTPVGDESMRLEWFFNGEALKASHRVRTVYAFGMVVLEVLGTKIADSGTYTCKAKNKWGRAECSCTLEVVDRAHGQPPHFTTQITSIENAKDGQAGHFECTLIPIGDPNMKVEWFHNGQPLRNATRIKTVNDFGFVVLDVAYLRNHDTGEWVCKASNKYGEDYTKAFINCTGKGGVYTDSLQPGALAKIAELEAHKGAGDMLLSPTGGEPPKFITQIVNIEQLVEGQSAHFEARLKPVGDPNLTVEWYKDGVKLSTKHRYRTFHDFGIVILDILYCYEEDSGIYEARAVNKLGEDRTSATLRCSSKAGLILSPQVPKGMEGGLDKIQHMEDTAWMRRQSMVSEKAGMPPKFTVPLNNIDDLKESENAHFEARLIPTDDPRLKLEWYFNGKPMKHSSRVRQLCDFGFVIMEISSVYSEDSGEYMCRAYNDYGEAVTKGILKCEGRRSIIFDSQLPKSMQRGMDKIAELEGLMIKSPTDGPKIDSAEPPMFITEPEDVSIAESQLAHFACKLTPVGDPNMRVEWYHNGRPLPVANRIKTINDFGYCILEISQCYGRDSGVYTCRAINKHGEAAVECKLNISSKSGIVLEPQASGHFKDVTDSILKLEEKHFKRDDIAQDEEKPCPPRFITELESITDLVEGQPAHFDCRVEPVGDSTMRIEWFHNGSQIGAGSRVHMMDDFGFVVLDLEWTFARDSGEYVCRATNKWGQATTTANLKIRSKHGIDMNTQLPQGMTAEKLKELERGPLTERHEPDADMAPPKFTIHLKDTQIEEGEKVLFTAHVEPRNDPNLRVEWYFNGKPLQSGHRFKTRYEMGTVTLELLYTYQEDSGEYVCRAVNKMGQDVTKASLKSKAAQCVIMQSQAMKGLKARDIVTQMEETLKKYQVKEIMLTAEDIFDVEKKQPPRFVTHIQDNTTLVEMHENKFDCQLTPVGDPNMKVEWFFNGRPLPYKNRFMPIYDFGYVALVMQWVYGEDSGEYLCRATNLYGMDETRAFIKVASRPGVIYDSQIPKDMKSLEKIRDLEAAWNVIPSQQIDEEKPRSKPEILKKPESLLVQEGGWARFSIRVAGYPKPRVMWIVNGSTAISGNRFKVWYDGMFHLDIPKTRQYDEGKIEVIARNSLGEAYACCELKVNPRQDDYRAVLKNSPKQHTEGISSQYRKPEWVTRMEVLKETMEAERTAPIFTQEITNGRVQEMDNFTFIASFKGNPKPEITWYCNDRLLQQSQVHQMRIRGDKAMLTVVQSSPENKGEYVCRAVNNVGETTCKATLEIIELTYEDKLKIDDERYAALQIQHAAEFMRLKEVERKEKENQEHKVRMSKMTEERKTRQIEKERELEEARKNIYKKEVKQKVEKIIKEEVKEEVIYKTPTERRIAEVYSGWKKPVELEQAYPVLEPEQFAPNQVPGVKCFVRVSETSMKGDEVVNEIAPQFFEDEQVIAEIAKVHNLLKNQVRINQIWSMFRAGEFKHLQQPKVQTALVKICEYIGHHRNVSMVLAEETEEQAKTHPVGLKALLRMITHAKDIKQEEFFKEVIPREMGKWSQATQELQKVSQMIKQGIENEEIIATCEAGKLPSLKKPETQLPLINIVEKQGYTVMVAQVLVEEATRDAKEERILAEKAWQIVHEDELVEAAVVKVEPEPAPLIEQKTIDIQEGLTPKHTAQSSIQETFEHITYETPMPITHKPAAQTTVETDKLEKPSVTEVFVDDIKKIPMEIKLPEEVEEITSQSPWRKPKRLPAQEEKPGEIVKLTPVKREVVITEVDKINEVTLKPLTNLETTVVQKEEIKPSAEEKQEPKRRKIKKVDVTLKEKEEVMEEVIKDKEETLMELTIEKQQPRIKELQEIKPQTVNWRKPKKLPLTEDEPQEVVTLKPFTKEMIQIEDEKIEVDLKPKKELETKVVQRDEVEKIIEFKKKPEKVMEVKEETEFLTEVYEEATQKTPQFPSDEILAEPHKPIEKIQIKEMEEIKPDKVTWRKPKRLPSAEEKPEEVVTLKPFTKEIMKTDEEKIEVTLKPLSEVEKEVIEKVEMKKLDKIKQIKPKKKKDEVTSEVLKGILKQNVVESVEETILPILKEEHPTITTTEDSLAKSVVTTTVVKQSKIEEEVKPETVSWRKSKPHPSPVEKPEEIVKLKPVKREKVTIEEESQEVILKPIPQIETTVKIDEKVEIKEVKKRPKQIITKEVQEQHAPEQPILSPKEEVMVYDDFHVPDSEYPKVTTTEEVLLKPDSTSANIREEKEIKIEKKRSKKKVVEKLKTTEETMDIATDESLYTEEINEFKVPKEKYIASKLLELEEASIQEAPTIIQDTIEKDTSIEAIALQRNIVTEEIVEITDEKQMKRKPRKILPEHVDSTEKVQLKPVSHKPQKEETKPEKVELKPSSIQEVTEIVEKDTSVAIVKKLKEEVPEEDIQETVTESVEYFKDTISKESPKITEHTTEYITAKITKPEQMIEDTKIILSPEKTEPLQPLIKEETAAREVVQEIETQEITVVEEPRIIQEKMEEKKIIKKKKIQKKVEIEDTEETSKIPEQVSKLVEEAQFGIEDTEVVKPFTYIKQTVKVEEEPTRQLESITITEVPTEIHKQEIVIKKTVHKPIIEEEIHTTHIEGKQLLTQEAQQVIQEQISTLVDQTIQQQLVKTLVEQESTIEEVQETEQQRKAPVKLDIKPAKSIKEVIEVDVVEPFQVDMPEKKRLQPKEEVGYKTHKATVSKVHSELSIPGFKALVNLATESFVDLEKIDLLPLERQKYEEDIVKLSFNLKKGVQVEELITMMKEDEFPSLKPVEDQAAILDVVDRFEHAAVNRVFVKECEDRPQKSIGTKSVIKSIETGKQTMEQVIMDVSKEFGPSSQPVREIAAVGQLLQEGVKCSEVLTLLDTGMLPALQKPETQAILVTMVTDRGHISSVCEVLVAESAAELTKELPLVNTARMTEVQDKLIKATAESVNVKTFTKEMVPGVKAYIKMAQEQKVDIQEMVKKSDIKEEIKREMIKIADMIKHGVIEKDVFSLMEAGEFPEFLKSETQAKLLNVVDDFGHTAIVSDIIIEQAVQQSEQSVGAKSFIRMTEQENIDLERILTSSLPKEITENKESIEDITKITLMMKQGTPSKDVITMMEAGQLPGLTMPRVQIPLVKVVESEGHTAIVCQVLIEESVKSIQADLPKVDVATIASVKTVLETASATQVLVQEEFSIQEAQLHIVEDTVEIAPLLDVRPGDQLRAIATYIVEDDHENAMHLVEGERVYVQECSNSDWWFVEKHLTKERGFVPAKLLAEEQSYTLYVQKRLEEKIQKLPVFDNLKKGEVARAPKILIKLEPKVVIDGQETQFVCKVEGHPRPNITWFRQTAIIKPSEEFQTFYSDDNTATLIIKEVFPEDAGMFTCVAKNQAGAAACSAELVVEGPMSDHGSDSITASRRSLSRESSVCDYLEGIPPTFAQKAVTKTTEEGLTIELDVRLVAIPEPEITWRKDGQAVRDSERIKIIKQKDVHAYRSILVIKDTKKDDEGVYEIVVRNREGEARNTVTLNVMAPAAPEFIERLKDTTVDDDGTIRLIARVRGNPIPDVSWSRNGQKLRNEKNIVMTFEEELVVLEIRGATREKDIGKYVCTATNKMGRVTDFCQVSVGREAVTFKKGLESCVVEEFSEVILECRTSKEVECKWQKDKHKIKESERIQIERSGLTHRLTINSAHVSDAGKYKCIFEKTSTWCNLTVKGSEEFIRKLEDVEVMEKQKAVLEVEVSKESAQVSWHKDGEEITDERFTTESEGGIRRLILTSATLSDEGEYTCVLGDLECSAELGVRELPAEISKKMKDQLVYKGHKASFEVELTKGDAVITWYKNDEEIKVSEHYQLSIDGKKQRLMVYNCQMDDAGFYRAVVGKSECSAVLTVELQPEGDFSKKLLSQLDVTSGSEVNFSVFITKAEYDVKWFKNQLELFETDKYILLKDENQRTLVIKSAARDDAGDYSCQLGKLISTCHLNVIVLECAPTIDRSLIQTEYVVKKGHDVTFTVPFKAEPLPTAAWIRKRKPIKESKKYLTTITENCATFTIKQVENIDCGDYRLELSNHCGDVSIDFTLKILDKPSKPGWPEILQITDDSVTIHWRAPDDDGGRTITNYLVEYKSKSSQKWMSFNQDFSITETTTIVTHLQTNEEYCFRTSAVNEMGTSEPSEESLYVKVCEPIRPEPPTVLEQLQPVVTGLHQKVVLRCVISGTPLPTIEWYKDGQLITSNTTYENFRATLTIKETSGNSSGMYTCRAFNEAGFNECSASVLVQESPKFEWDESLQCQRLSVGDRWHIPIQVTGYPQPKVTWTRNDQPITSSHRVIIHTEEEEGHTDIAIQKLEQNDSAIFTLSAENSAGKATLSFNLRVVEQEKEVEEEIVVEHKEEIQLERPGPPNGPLQFDDVTGSSVRLTWKLSTYNGGAEITSYYIEKLEKGQKQWQNVDEVDADVTSYTVQNLNEGREYFFRIFASNVMGLSDALEGSETVFIKNPFDVPGPPNGPFDVGNLADSSLLLKWEEPDTDGGSPITGYLLERREAFKKAWQRVGQTAAEVTQMEITGLKRGSAYFFRVFAMNEVGQGPPFQPDEPITAGKKITVPSMPTGLNVIDVTSRTVTLGWAPPSTTGGADLIGYVIQSRLTSESSWKMVRTVDPSVTLFCVENLREKSEYEFRVFAENPVGLSERAAMTEKVQLKTHATPPSPPTAPLEARPTGPTSLMIEWGAPESDGGAPILGYIIAIRDIKRTMWIEVGQVDANFTRLHIKELQENHEYNVRVFARNEIGTSDPLETEDPVQILRPDGFQELPEDDAAPSLSYSTTETLSWMREAGVDADIYSYARGRLLNRDEYFFKVWHQQQKRREE